MRARARRTSPRSRRILKLRLLILSVGEPGKQLRQFPNDANRSSIICAIVRVFEVVVVVVEFKCGIWRRYYEAKCLWN